VTVELSICYSLNSSIFFFSPKPLICFSHNQKSFCFLVKLLFFCLCCWFPLKLSQTPFDHDNLLLLTEKKTNKVSFFLPYISLPAFSIILLFSYTVIMIPFFVFFFLLLQNSFAILDPIDFLALQAIRKGLDDLPGSNYFASWDFTSEPCNFAGVYCDGDKVIALNLGDPRAGSPGLTGNLDPSIGKLSALSEFTVVPGRITGALPESFSQLKNLRFLGVSRNFLSGDIPASLGLLRELQTLDLSFNQLTGSIPWAIGALPALSNIILCHNHLSGSIPPFVSQRLTRLDLKHNSLSGTLLPNSLPSSLQYLSLSWNQLTGPVDYQLSRLNQLNYLDLSLNRFKLRSR